MSFRKLLSCAGGMEDYHGEKNMRTTSQKSLNFVLQNTLGGTEKLKPTTEFLSRQSRNAIRVVLK